MTTQVIFRKKSSFQKDDCINRSKEYDCPNESVIEATCSKGNNNPMIRCCENEECKKVAAEMALHYIS